MTVTNKNEHSSAADNCPCCSLAAELSRPPKPKQWPDLEARLLTLGGTRVVWYGYEPELKRLIQDGIQFLRPVRQEPGEKSDCHQNVAKIWGKDVTGVTIATGYGLSEDGLWRQHSWAFKDDFIIETTVTRTHYFGIALDELAALQFWFANFMFHRHPKVKTYREFKEAISRYIGPFRLWKAFAAAGAALKREIAACPVLIDKGQVARNVRADVDLSELRLIV